MNKPKPVDVNDIHDFELTAGPWLADQNHMVITDYLKQYTKGGGSEYMQNAKQAERFLWK